MNDDQTPKPLPEQPPEIDALVTDIQRTDSDTELEAAFTPSVTPERRSLKQKYLDNKKWTIPLTILFIALIVIFGLPATRYRILGIFISHPYEVTFTDATTHNPVTDATVKLGSFTKTTDAKGAVIFPKVKLGKQELKVTKQYYKTYVASVFVGISKPAAQKQKLTATGRQVSVSVANAITHLPISGADISVLGTSAQSDKGGYANLVLPADKASAEGEVTANGYNNSTVKVVTLSNNTSDNYYLLVPAGRVYFLSNQSGKVDVVSTNYDGSDRQTITTGTGYENTSSTKLIASSDQKYLALISRRTSAQNGVGLYIINTATSKLAKVEELPNASISNVGWAGNDFVYSVNDLSLNPWQTASSLLKSYNASTSTGVTLDQTQAEGDQSDYALQNFSTTSIIDNNVLYATYWTSSLSSSRLASKTDSINSVQSDGSNKKSLKSGLTIPDGGGYVAVYQAQAGPEVSYFAMPTTSQGLSSNIIIFKYTKGNLTQTNNFTFANFTDPNIGNGYVALSPSGQKSLFQDIVDGQLKLSVGDVSGQNKTAASLLPVSGYVVGWLGENYVLVSQSSSKLYVTALDMSSNAKMEAPLFVSNFLGQ
jgi:hypothetical protein